MLLQKRGAKCSGGRWLQVSESNYRHRLWASIYEVPYIIPHKTLVKSQFTQAQAAAHLAAFPTV